MGDEKGREWPGKKLPGKESGKGKQWGLSKSVGGGEKAATGRGVGKKQGGILRGGRRRVTGRTGETWRL